MGLKTTHKTIIAFTLRELWISRGWTTLEVSAIMGEKFSYDKLQLIDRGQYFPQMDEVKSLCHAMETSLGYVVGYADGVAAHLKLEGWAVKYKLDGEETDDLITMAESTHNEQGDPSEFQTIRNESLFHQIMRAKQ